MSGKTISLVLTVALLALAGVFFLLQYNTHEQGGGDRNALGEGFLGPYDRPGAVITRTNGGYEPRDVTIKVGEAVSFVNEGDEYHWPASDVHPTHTIYSEFDPDAPIAPGETWTFIFSRAGEWQYHDHIRANLKGTITVTE